MIMLKHISILHIADEKPNNKNYNVSSSSTIDYTAENIN